MRSRGGVVKPPVIQRVLGVHETPACKIDKRGKMDAEHAKYMPGI
jgi:hypothetical protein